MSEQAVLDNQINDEASTFNTEEQLRSALENGFQVGAAKAFSQAWELFKKGGGMAVGFMVLVQIGSGMISGFPLIGFIVNLGLFLLTRVFNLGYAIYADRLWRDQEAEFGIFFDGFKKWGAIVAATIIVYLFMALILGGPIINIAIKMIPFILEEQMPDFELIIDDYKILALLSIPAGLIGILYIFTEHFIFFGKMDFWQAMEASRKLVMRNFLGFLGLFILAILVNLLGVLCLIVGVFVTAPLTYFAFYCVYKNIIGTPAPNADDDHEIISDRKW